jgi:hypothetical protein
MLVNVLMGVTAFGGAITALLYWRLRRQGLVAYEQLMKSEGKDFIPAREKYWSLDKNGKWMALAIVGLWVLTMVAMMIVHTEPEFGWRFRTILIVVSTSSVWAAVGLRSLYKDREFAVRLGGRTYWS